MVGPTLYFSQHRFRDHFDRSACGKEELGGQFILPLWNQVIGHDNKHHGVMWLINDVLTDQDAGLDGFPKAHFVSKKISLDRIGENPSNSGDLMFQQLHSGGSEGSRSTKCGTLRRNVAHDLHAPIKEKGVSVMRAAK